jgi:hypothetical protein
MPDQARFRRMMTRLADTAADPVRRVICMEGRGSAVHIAHERIKDPFGLSVQFRIDMLGLDDRIQLLSLEEPESHTTFSIVVTNYVS